MRKGLTVLALVCGIAALLLVSAPAAEEGSTATENAALVPAKIPDSARLTNNPRAGAEQSIQNGKQIFASQCTMCHGANGNGKGDLATRYGYEIPDFTSAGTQQSRTDGEWFYILTHGHGKMSGEGDRLSEETRWDLVSFIRSLGPPEGQ